MGDFEQSLRDQFGSERNKRIAVLKTTANLLRARLEAAEARETALWEALEKLTDWGLSPDDVVEIARDALSQPSPAAERVRALIDAAIRWAEARNGCLETCHGAQLLADYGQASDELEAAVQKVKDE